MAKRKVNKSAKIREYLDEHPGAGPSETANALKQYGITPAHVSNVKSRSAPAPGRRKKRGRRKGARSASRNGMAPGPRRKQVTPLVAAAELIRVSGSVEEAKAALETAGQVASILR